MTSILENSSPKTHIDFYIMLSGDFEDSLKTKIKSIKNEYKKCSISFIDMKGKLKDLYTSGHIKTASYYRVLLPDILLNLNKIIYMDVDTITQHDLSDLFNIDVDGYYLAGVPDIRAYGGNPLYDDEFKNMFIKRFGGKENLKNIYVCSGILLFNLRKMREDKLMKKLIKCASSHKFNRHDQDTLNYVCYNKIKNIDNIFNCAPYLIDNIRNQVIIHYMVGKPWNNRNVKCGDIWWTYAQKTGYINEIQDKFLDETTKKQMRLKSINNVIKMIRELNKVA